MLVVCEKRKFEERRNKVSDSTDIQRRNFVRSIGFFERKRGESCVTGIEPFLIDRRRIDSRRSNYTEEIIAHYRCTTRSQHRRCDREA